MNLRGCCLLKICSFLLFWKLHNLCKSMECLYEMYWSGFALVHDTWMLINDSYIFGLLSCFYMSIFITLFIKWLVCFYNALPCKLMRANNWFQTQLNLPNGISILCTLLVHLIWNGSKGDRLVETKAINWSSTEHTKKATKNLSQLTEKLSRETIRRIIFCYVKQPQLNEYFNLFGRSF